MPAGIINQRMPNGVASGFIGGPQFSTRVNELANGTELRNRAWTYPKSKFTADIAAFNRKQLETLRDMIYATAGQWAAFRFRDPTDWSATDEAFSTVAGTKTPAQLTKTYSFGGQSTTRRIQGPIAAQTVVSVGDTVIAGVVDEESGLFTPADNWPASAATWSGQFDVWVRFTADYTPMNFIRTDLSTLNIELVEVYL